MASIFTGLAFMHGHIVDTELVMALGRAEPVAGTRKAHDALATREAKKAREGDDAMACAPECC